MDREYLHISDAKAFRDCRRRWRLGSPRQMNLTPIVPTTSLWLGTGIHLALQWYYQRFNNVANLENLGHEAVVVFNDWAVDQITHVRANAVLSTDQLADLEDNRELGLEMLRHYFPWARAHDDFTVEGVEHEFEQPFNYPGVKEPLIVKTPKGPRELWVKGRIDGLVRKDGFLWLLEHKTMRAIESDYFALTDEQGGVYINAMEAELGEPIVGIFYNLLRKKAPTVPETLVSGGLTKRKNIDTTYEVYLDTLQKNNLDPAPYAEILEQLKQRGDVFYRREPVFRGIAERRRLVDTLYAVASDMHNEPVIYPTPDFFKCRQCPFRAVSFAMAADADWKFVLESGYESRKDFELAPEPVAVED